MNAREKYEQEMTELAERAYDQHELYHHEVGSQNWIIKRPRSGEFWTEIINLYGGGVLLHGDGDTCLFRWYDGHKDQLAAIRRIARSSLGYIAEKEAIGISGRQPQYEQDVFVDDLLDMFDDDDEYATSRVNEKYGSAKKWADAIAEEIFIYDMNPGTVSYDPCDLEDILDLAELGWVEDEIYLLGRVHPLRIYHARAACAKLLELLEGEN